jgi:peroxidase
VRWTTYRFDKIFTEHKSTMKGYFLNQQCDKPVAIPKQFLNNWPLFFKNQFIIVVNKQYPQRGGNRPGGFSRKRKCVMQRNRILSSTLSLTLTTLLIFTTMSIAQALPGDYRTINGTENNLVLVPDQSSWGSAGIQLQRTAPEGYDDGISTPAGATRKSPREISNIMATQKESILNSLEASDFIWQWGQFVDHDIDLTTERTDLSLPIDVPEGDPYFDPDSIGGQTIGFHRSVFDEMSNPRQQLNEITSFIDASNVYGSDVVRATALRTMDGTGKLKTTSGGQFLPFNTDGLPNAGGDDNKKLFLAGDIRANEQIALTAMHTLFVREHNRLCDEIAEPGLNGEEIYQRARKIVGAQMQFITYNEFLPILLGPGAIPIYGGYDDSVDPAIGNEFSAAAYRLGHSMLSATLLRYNKAGNKKVSTPLKDAFFNPNLIHKGGGMSILRGLQKQQAQEVDNKVVDAVRNFLFGDPGEGGFDLASANIQRGRDHGLADYNAVRVAYGLAPLNFSQISDDGLVEVALKEAYRNEADEIDLWVGGLAETPKANLGRSFVGETFQAILVDQFTRLRDGDRFWYQNDKFFTDDPVMMMKIESTKLADIIHRNTHIGDELPDDVFHIQP